jgi:chromosomal replication initiator protein
MTMGGTPSPISSLQSQQSFQGRLPALDLWRDIVASLEAAGQISPENLAVYFQATSQVRYDRIARRLVVRVPNSRFSRWISHQYGDLLKSKMGEMGFPNAEIVFQPDLDESQSSLISSPHLLGSYVGAAECNLNQRYTFANFVVGSSNQFAHAAALAVAERPSRSYNPLFLYGGVGLGKTHLMHAIGHSIKIEFPSANLAYVPSERFTNDLVHSIRYLRTASFRQKYRSVDVLLMDDVQFLAGKEKTQEEFFHTFNSLYDAQKQIVISSDSPPQEIPTLEERLHSRFQWGLIADIQAPDLETKVAILRQKAALQQVELPDDVAFFISSNTKSNIRQLEGSLIRLIAYSSLIGEEITLDLAQSTLKDLAESAQRVITIEEIQRVVSRHHSLTMSQLMSRSNSPRIVFPRQIAMYLCKELTQASLPQTGRAFGNRHHTTVLHAVRKISRLVKHDPLMRSTVNKLTDEVS